jgi:hypothetical protein
VGIRKRKVSILLAAVAVFFLAIYLAKSDERTFVKVVQDQLRIGSEVIDLSTSMGDEWETVCNSHGYDSLITLSKYGRTYQPVGAPQDGAWGLIFIKKDGSFESVTGSCRQGFDFDFGCLDRSNAKLTYLKQNYACTKLTHPQR